MGFPDMIRNMRRAVAEVTYGQPCQHKCDVRVFGRHTIETLAVKNVNRALGLSRKSCGMPIANQESKVPNEVPRMNNFLT